jgi:hypothetical protein
MIYGVFITSVVFGCITVLVLQSFEQATVRPLTCESPACNDDAVLCPGYQICEKEIIQSLVNFEIVLIIIAAADYVARVSLCAFVPARIAGIIQTQDLDKKMVMVYPWYLHIYYYCKLPFNIIDFLATFPILLVLLLPTYSSEHTAVALVLRLFRLGRLLRLAKLPALREGVSILTLTLSRALPALTLLSMVVFLKMLLFGQLMYIFERGDYEINEDYPSGAYLRWNIDHSSREESPFQNMFVSMYWAFVTITTVG